MNADGSAPLRFAEEWHLAAKRPGSAPAARGLLWAGFLELADALVRHSVRFYDPQNSLVQRIADGRFRLRITDFEPASRLLVPVDAVPAVARLKVRRRFARYLRNWGLSPEGAAA